MILLLLSLLSLLTPNLFCITDLILLHKRALGMQDTMKIDAKFKLSKMQIGSHVIVVTHP